MATAMTTTTMTTMAMTVTSAITIVSDAGRRRSAFASDASRD